MEAPTQLTQVIEPQELPELLRTAAGYLANVQQEVYSSRRTIANYTQEKSDFQSHIHHLEQQLVRLHQELCDIQESKIKAEAASTHWQQQFHQLQAKNDSLDQQQLIKMQELERTVNLYRQEASEIAAKREAHNDEYAKQLEALQQELEKERALRQDVEEQCRLEKERADSADADKKELRKALRKTRAMCEMMQNSFRRATRDGNADFIVDGKRATVEVVVPQKLASSGEQQQNGTAAPVGGAKAAKNAQQQQVNNEKPTVTEPLPATNPQNPIENCDTTAHHHTNEDEDEDMMLTQPVRLTSSTKVLTQIMPSNKSLKSKKTEQRDPPLGTSSKDAPIVHDKQKRKLPAVTATTVLKVVKTEEQSQLCGPQAPIESKQPSKVAAGVGKKKLADKVAAILPQKRPAEPPAGQISNIDNQQQQDADQQKRPAKRSPGWRQVARKEEDKDDEFSFSPLRGNNANSNRPAGVAINYSNGNRQQAPQQQPKPQEGGGGYRYQEVVRKKDDRAKLPAFECDDCRRFYAALEAWGANADQILPQCKHITSVPEAAVGQNLRGNAPPQAQQPRRDMNRDVMRRDAGRHRYANAPPSTPKGFWHLDDFSMNDDTDHVLEVPGSG